MSFLQPFLSDQLIPALAVLLLFGGTVLVHELGHFLTAKWFGLRIDTFSVGMGPALWQRKIKGVVYKIGLLPIGGYVALPQMDITGSAFENQDAAEGRLEPVAPWKRIIIAVAGPVMNVLAAFLLCLIVWWQGKPADPGPEPAVVGWVQPESEAYVAGLREGDLIRRVNDDRVIFWADFQIASMLNDRVNLQLAREGQVVYVPGVATGINRHGYRQVLGVGPRESDLLYVAANRVMPNSPAERAGVRRGDRLLRVNGKEISDMGTFIDAVQASKGGEVLLDLRRRKGGEEVQLTLLPERTGEDKAWRVGIEMSGEFELVHPPPLQQMRFFQGSILRTLRAFTRKREMGRAAQGVGGPVMILSGMHSQVRFHPMQALWFTALINVNLAIINLLPLIILDGGHITVALFEWISGRKLHRRLVIGLANTMVVVLILLMVVLSFRDVRFLRRLYESVEATATPAPAVETPAAPTTPDPLP